MAASLAREPDGNGDEHAKRSQTSHIAHMPVRARQTMPFMGKSSCRRHKYCASSYKFDSFHFFSEMLYSEDSGAFITKAKRSAGDLPMFILPSGA
jgi:hypothetical protein